MSNIHAGRDVNIHVSQGTWLPSQKTTEKIGYLPEPDFRFSGRADLLDSLKKKDECSYKEKGISVLSLYGPSGIGKTRLAIEYACKNRNQYEDIFFIDSSGEEILIAYYTKLAKQLKRYTSEDTVLSDRIRSFLNNPSFLIIYDGVQDFGLLQKYMPSGGHIIVTSCSAKPRAIPIEIPPLEENEFYQYISKFPKIKFSPLQIKSLYKAIDGLPIVVEKVVEYINNRVNSFPFFNLEEFIKTYELDNKPILGLNKSKPTLFSTWSLILKTIRSQSELAFKLLKLSAFLNNLDVPVSLLKISIEQENKLSTVKDFEKNFEDALILIERTSMFKKINQAKGTISFHDLVQECIVMEMDQQEIRLIISTLADSFHKNFRDCADVQGIESNYCLYVNFVKFFNQVEAHSSILTNKTLLLIARSCHTAFSFGLRSAKMNEGLLNSAKKILKAIEIKKLNSEDKKEYNEVIAIRKNIKVWYCLLVKDYERLRSKIESSREAVFYWEKRAQISLTDENVLRNLLTTTSNYSFALVKIQAADKYLTCINLIKKILEIVPESKYKNLAHQRAQCYSAIGQLYFQRKDYEQACDAFINAYKIFSNKSFFSKGHDNINYIKKWYHYADDMRKDTAEEAKPCKWHGRLPNLVP